MNDQHATIAASIRALSNTPRLPVHVSSDFSPLPFAGTLNDFIALQKTAGFKDLRQHGDYAAAVLRYRNKNTDLTYHEYAHDLEALRCLVCLVKDYPGTRRHVSGFLPVLSSNPKFSLLWGIWSQLAGDDIPDTMPVVDLGDHSLADHYRDANAYHDILKTILDDLSKDEAGIQPPSREQDKEQTVKEDESDDKAEDHQDDIDQTPSAEDQTRGHQKTDTPERSDQDTTTTKEQQGDNETDDTVKMGMVDDTPPRELDNEEVQDNDNVVEMMKRDRVKASKQTLSQTTDYRVYTTQYDEVTPATSLAMLCDQVALRKKLDDAIKNDGLSNSAVRLANRLQRILMAQKRHQWRRNTDQGILDTHHLARVVVDPTYPMAHKRRITDRYDETVVSIVIDNSGSMRGRPILLATICADILTKTLERCGVATEVLGFTTKEWKGGQSYRDWILKGSPKGVGRLNDLRHIVYKSADQPYRRSRHSMSVMLKDSILKENIDGEALLWAEDRLARRPETRKIMIVISDGAPVDDATAVANNNDTSFLEKHLKVTANYIENHTPTELIAIGIGHDVSAYYKNAFVISGAEQLAETMMKELTRLLV